MWSQQVHPHQRKETKKINKTKERPNTQQRGVVVLTKETMKSKHMWRNARERERERERERDKVDENCSALK
jgi:hypothetical protein